MGLGLFVAACAACARHGQPERASEPRDASPPSLVIVDAGADTADASPANAALSAPSDLVELLDGREKLGFVSVPVGAREPRPIMIAIHGGSDKPERACAAWRGVSEAYPFVVCPRGFGGNDARLGWRTTADTAERIARAVAATKSAFPSWVKDTTTIVLAGFSMGGSQVANLAGAFPRTYLRIVVGDSAHDPRPALGFSKTWASGGGQRAVFLCTTSGCEPALRAAARNVAAQKAPARLNIAPTQVHGLSEPVVQSMRRDFPWLVEGAEGWEGYAAPTDPALPGKTEAFDPP